MSLMVRGKESDLVNTLNVVVEGQIIENPRITGLVSKKMKTPHGMVIVTAGRTVGGAVVKVSNGTDKYVRLSDLRYVPFDIPQFKGKKVYKLAYKPITNHTQHSQYDEKR